MSSPPSNTDRRDRYLLFVEYFNHQEYMPAQTALDPIWIQEEGEDKNFYGGLIQVAVSLFHLTHERNPKGASKLYSKAREFLLNYGEEHRGISLQKLLRELDTLFQDKVDLENRDMDYSEVLPQIELAEDAAL